MRGLSSFFGVGRWFGQGEVVEGRGSLVRVVCVGGMNKSFQCADPVPGKRPRPGKKEKVVHQDGDAFPFAAGRGQVHKSVVRTGVKNLG